MQFDREITIATAGTRFGPWQNQKLLLSEFYTRLAAPARGTEIRAAYLALPKREQDKRKDVGGFVGGALTDGTRKNGHVAARCLLTLDIDKVEAGGAPRILAALEALCCGYACYSTRKHAPEAPRLRAVLPLAADLTEEEYEPAARLLAHYLDPTMQCFDRTTFEAARLMYWPSCCADAEYLCRTADKAPVDGRALLATLPNWRDIASWPRCPDEDAAVHKAATRQQAPETKEGMVGAFCRVYDIPKALDAYLPGVYIPCDNAPGRYTYAGGSTSGGAVLYEDGRFLYSHHATDPAGGHLCNAFDLVRLHRFAALDEEAKPGTPPGRLPSYAAMCKLSGGDPAVAAQLDEDSAARARAAFGDILAAQQQAPATAPQIAAAVPPERQWKLVRNDSGSAEDTQPNARAALELDALLQNRILFDDFAGRNVCLGPFPWNPTPGYREWEDADDSGVFEYLSKIYGFKSRVNVLGALQTTRIQHRIDPVRNYLEHRAWDGVPRLDTLFVDYLGARDTPYVRAVTRKIFVAAVARVYQPGVQFDQMLVLVGPQGIGKSTLLRLMGGNWFSDAIKTFEGKDAQELLQGVWVAEIGELGYLSRSDENLTKQFLSQRVDRFRPAYGRNPVARPRRCVFFGTTNVPDFLKDTTGNRRFWPVEVRIAVPRYNLWEALDSETVDQLWAEAKTRWQLGEPLLLTKELEKEADRIRAEHMQVDSTEGIIREWLDLPVPLDWEQRGSAARQFWNPAAPGQEKTKPRDHACAVEVWVEALGGSKTYFKQSDARRINRILAATPGWEPCVYRTKEYGKQRGFSRGTDAEKVEQNP